MDKDEMKRRQAIEEKHNLYIEVMQLLAECNDDEVIRWFDDESYKYLKLKKKILTALNNGEDSEQFGDDYYKILEKRVQE